MLSSRKALISNLNYVHLQHVSLGVHLSKRPEMKEGTTGQDTGLKDVSGCLHQWKDTSDTILVDANSNDPSVPCQCCDQHFGHEKSLQYGSNENLEAIMCDDYLSPDDLPLSPLSPSSPSTDSSSSSDFTLDDSPVSMYYREYAEDNLDTPDQQPNIIPLDIDFNEPDSSILDSLNPSTSNTITDSESSQSNSSELTVNNNNVEPDDVPFIDWSSDTILDSNCNAVENTQQPDLPSLSFPPTEADKAADPEPQTSQNIASVNQIDFPLWPVDEDILPGLSMPEASATQTPKKTITSFHELAQKRRRSGVQLPQPLKKDKSDWLIVFSPDTEQPPLNELTTSAFYQGLLMPQSQPLHEGKEVTTFKELRYRSTNNKQSDQQTKAHYVLAKGHQGSNEEEASATTEAHHLTEESNISCPFIKDKTNFQDLTTKDSDNLSGLFLNSNKEPDQARRLQKPDTEIQEAPQRLWSQKDYRPSGLTDTSSAVTGWMGQHNSFVLKNGVCSGQKENQTRVRRRGMADGGDRRGLEVFGAQPPTLLFRLATNLTSPPALSPSSSTLEVPRCFALPPQTWYPKLPVRMSPVGAYSPPQRALLPLLDTPDVAILLSPLFPRIQSRKMGPANTANTGGDIELLMADGDEESAPREKKSLLVSIGSAVDKIISHFNASRNQVQKAQLGDSRLSPKLGYLILNNLCPSLYSLIGDGLKSFQKDVIIGRRRLSPWNLVEVSTKSGLESLHVLFYKVSHLQQLRDPQRRFNAFIFGLLNTKQLDIWVYHLHQIYEELSLFYSPTGFLPLAATSRPDLCEELMLILQPLSALTFHTDLLFEHYHLPLQEPLVPQHPPPQASDNWGVPSFQDIVHLGNWLAHNLSGSVGKETQKSNQSPSQSCVQNVHRVSGDSQLDEASCSNHSPKDSFVPNTSQDVSSPITSVTQTPTQVTISKTKDSSTTWWGHLSQASRMYIPAKKESFAFPSFKKLPSWGSSDPQDQSPPDQQFYSKQREFTEQRVPDKLPLDSQKVDNGNELLNFNIEASRDPAAANISRDENPTPVEEDSALCKKTKNGNTTTPTQTLKEKVHWFGQLFGANSTQGCETEGKPVKSRRPSSWLPPNVNVMNLMRKTSTPEREASAAEEVEKPRSEGKPERALRALCDHAASGETQLSFRKGDILQLLGTVDEDWIRCRHGDDTGLVPVGYTSLIL
ncbi:AP-4 complex accessory subunit RUSC1 isoform X2 [Hyperolius riggenbachi]|uniref:AP-4 complex accessory subunit RUSC1 isoform X2 n=1 Tax=Hyperolius riggenbachi TaxID=752182 RepID=UPI0035A360E8